MRPLRLEFTAFGSYPGRQEVDFEALGRRGLFVVTGPTGTGKTTVFDAMVYALFGEMPGARSAISDLRSHFADGGAETSVTLDFEVDDARYRITRVPRQERAKQRGTGTTVVPATATLVRLTGTGTEPIATQAKACTDACEQLVGLDAARFQRVVLLPQGRFTDFLLAKDSDRESLLRELFGGHLYEVAIEWLKRRVGDLRAQLGEADNELVRLRRNCAEHLAAARGRWHPTAGDDDFDPMLDGGVPLDELDAERRTVLIAELSPARAAAEAAATEAHALALAAAGSAATAVDEATRFDDARTAREQLAELEVQRPEVEADGRRAERSAAARPVVAAAAAADHAAALAVEAAATEQARRDAVVAALAELGESIADLTEAAATSAVERAQQQLAADMALLDTAAAAATAAERAEVGRLEAERSLEAAVVARNAAQADVERGAAEVERLRSAALAAPDLDARVAAASTRVDQRADLSTAEATEAAACNEVERCEAAHLEVMARFIATQAPRLAQQLVPGDPCPVCGSAEPPAPAQFDDGEPADQDAIDAARAALDTASGVLSGCRQAVAALRASLGDDAAVPVDELRSRLETVEAERRAAHEAAAAFAGAESALSAAQAAAASADRAHADAVTALAVAGIDAERLVTDRSAALAASAHLDAASIEVRRTQVAAARNAAEGLGAVLTATATAAEAARLQGAARDESLEASGFDSVDAARGALLDLDDEQRLLADAAAHAAAVAAATTRLRTLEQQGIPDERPDADAANQRAVHLGVQAAELAKEVNAAAKSLDDAATALRAESTVTAGSAGLRVEYDDVRSVFATCNGEAGMKVRLDRWVLAGELERVTEAANVHLARMTGHRYRLLRDAAAKGGLTLEVFDAHSGRTRPPSSLSGGEQFQASLSLALGLADVVSHGGAASGRQFEALFVDEGFGSLDPEALDDAISALSMLQATGRMVGAITHVEAMKLQLHVGIEVQRLADGRGSRLVVHP